MVQVSDTMRYFGILWYLTLVLLATIPVVAERGRVRIINNNLVADNGRPLRGEHMFVTQWATGPMYNDTYWLQLRDQFKLNTVRLLLYQSPVNGKTCNNSSGCFDLTYSFGGKTVLQHIDAMVNKAAKHNMYIIIDYHPVGGHVEQDAYDWWKVVAPRYKDRTHVIYEACNEPVSWVASQYDAADVAFEENLYQTIRTRAPETHIILWTFSHATSDMYHKVKEGSKIDYTNASVAFHPYGSYSEVGILLLRTYYPVINTEIGGESHNQYTSRLANAERIGLSWITMDGMKSSLGPFPDWYGISTSEVTWDADPGCTTPITDHNYPSVRPGALEFPNPFGPGSKISFQLKQAEPVNIRVFDLQGTEVTTITDQQYQAGAHTVEWNPSGLARGVYFYNITTGRSSGYGEFILVND